MCKSSPGTPPYIWTAKLMNTKNIWNGNDLCFDSLSVVCLGFRGLGEGLEDLRPQIWIHQQTLHRFHPPPGRLLLSVPCPSVTLTVLCSSALLFRAVLCPPTNLFKRGPGFDLLCFNFIFCIFFEIFALIFFFHCFFG